MDCEKYEPLLLDELYDELDELTSAAVKRHVSGCARCAASLNGMKATRSLAVLPVVDLPEGLEERIFAAAKEARKVVPIQSRLSRAISLAGSWAMRPQTAMAAVFLLMLGSSAFVLRAKRDAAPEAAVSVEVAGAPAALAAAEHDPLDGPTAAAAHGALAHRPVATAAPPQSEPGGPLDEITGGAARERKEDGALASAFAAEEEGKGADHDERRGFAAPKVAAKAESASGAGRSAAPGPMPLGAAPPATPAPSKRAGETQDGFSAGMAAYRARQFSEATRHFDAAAASGNTDSALWAAHSTRDGSGCAVALGRYDALARRASGSHQGHEAELEAARCQIALGQLDAARARLAKLSSVPSHAARAEAATSELHVAERSKAAGAGGGAGAARPAARAPAPKPAATAAPAAPAQASDKAAGY
jgi:hypothetical protein